MSATEISRSSAEELTELRLEQIICTLCVLATIEKVRIHVQRDVRRRVAELPRQAHNRLNFARPRADAERDGRRSCETRDSCVAR